jgi:cytochrome c
MRKRHALAFVALVALLASALAARAVAETAGRSDEMKQALADYGCIACHGEAEMRIGPPFHAIARRYSAATDEQIYVLTRKVLRGGAGNWGIVPMNAQPDLPSAEAARLVTWIIGQGTTGTQ